MTIAHPRIDVIAACRVLSIGDGDHVERVGVDDDAEFWGHYIMGYDGRQLWQADYGSLEQALAGAARAGARTVVLDGSGRLTPAT